MNITSSRVVRDGFTASFIALFVWAHVASGNQFPPPWQDEAWFLFPAKSFGNALSLLAPQLNPERPVMWMPPGFMVVYGLILKVIGFSLFNARLISLALMIAFFLLLVRVLRDYELSVLTVPLAGLFLLNGEFVAAGNIARMEALLLVTVMSGVVVWQAGRPLTAILVLALTPLIHPNGSYFVVWGIAVTALYYRELNLRPTRRDLVLFLFVLVAWSAYGAFVAGHWSSFVHDMTYQMVRKSQKDFGALLAPRHLALLALAVLCAVYGFRRRMKVTLLLTLFFPCWAIASVGQELWYDVFGNIACLALSIFLLHVFWDALRSQTFARDRVLTGALMLMAWTTIAFVAFQRDLIPDPRYFPRNLHAGGLSWQRAPYFTRDEEHAIRDRLLLLKGAPSPVYVELYPYGDSLLFQDLEGGNLHFSEPLFHDRQPDLFIVHRSGVAPAWFEISLSTELARAGIDLSDPGEVMIARDDRNTVFIKDGR